MVYMASLPKSVERKFLAMRALKQARKLIEKKPESPAAQALSTLVVALESETPFALQSLYQLDYDDFELALDVLKEWRLDRYYSSKVRLLDLSVQVEAMRVEDKSKASVVTARATPAPMPAAAPTAKA